MFVKYEVYKNKEPNPLSIKSREDYQNFLNELYKFSDNFTCKVVYSVYKQVGKDEKGTFAFQLSLIVKIGPFSSNIRYPKSYIKQISYVDTF